LRVDRIAAVGRAAERIGGVAPADEHVELVLRNRLACLLQGFEGDALEAGDGASEGCAGEHGHLPVAGRCDHFSQKCFAEATGGAGDQRVAPDCRHRLT
jgi:hypothetical protein